MRKKPATAPSIHEDFRQFMREHDEHVQRVVKRLLKKLWKFLDKEKHHSFVSDLEHTLRQFLRCRLDFDWLELFKVDHYRDLSEYGFGDVQELNAAIQNIMDAWGGEIYFTAYSSERDNETSLYFRSLPPLLLNRNKRRAINVIPRSTEE